MSNALTIRFGNRIRILRKARNLSQEEFADKCGLDRTYISGIERGVRNPTLNIIGILAEGLGLSISQLCETV